MASFYEKNINALIKKDPMLGASLFAIKENSRFEIFQGNDALDINILDTQANDFVYQKPANELTTLVEDMHDKYVRYPILFFYGIGNGLLLRALLENESLKHLVIIEPNIELIYVALNFIDVVDDIESDRLIIQLSSEVNFNTALSIMERKHVKPYAKLYNLRSHTTYYERNYQDDMNNVSAMFIRAYKHIVLGHGNDTIDALIGIEQHVANLEAMLKTYSTKKLMKQKISDVAVVVSTGPSLTKQLPLLKKYAPYITIISVDASLPILYKHGIKPDVVTSMERVVETASFFDNLDDEFLKDTYFVVSSLADLYTIHKLKKQKLVLSMRPLSYMLYYDLDDFGYLGSGMSASNLAYQLAAFMEYKDIILIGQDLAYAKDGVSHADGHKFMFNEKDKNRDDLYIEAYGGDGFVKTTVVWNMFRNFFETDINEARECCEIITYNSTEGGARIIGSIEKPFKDALEDVVDTTKEKSKIKLRRVRKDVSAKLIKKAKEQTDHMVEYGSTLKKEVEELFLKVAKECEHIEEIDKKDVDYDELLKLIEEIDEVKAKVETLEFSKMYIDTVQSYIYHQELNLAKLMVENSKTDEEKKDKLIKWLKIHRYWLFSLAGGIDAQLFAVERGKRLNELKINEFKFLDNLSKLINKEKIIDLKVKNNIGFLANEENLNDKIFIEYIQYIYKKFPEIRFKVFYFNKEQKSLIESILSKELDKIDLIIPKNIYDIGNSIDIYILNNKNNRTISNLLGEYFQVATTHHNIENDNFTIDTICKIHKSTEHPFLMHPEYFGFTKQDVEDNNFSIHKILYMPFTGKIDSGKNLYEYMSYNVFDELIINDKFKKFYIEYNYKSIKFNKK